MADYFLWLKAFHVIAVVAWMAALLYLPRLFVYHAGTAAGGDVSEQFKVMERRLALGIMWPAAIASWILGGLTAVAGGYTSSVPAWLMMKLVLVILLSLVHGLLHVHLRDFAADRRTRTGTYFRVLNEVPTLLLIGIVLLVVVKPGPS